MKFILITLAISGLLSPAFANKQSANPYFDGSLENIQIHPARAEKVKQLLVESRRKRKEIMEAARSQVSSLQTETHEKIADILTEEELQAYNAVIDAQQQAFMKNYQWNKPAAAANLPQENASEIHVSKL